MPFRRTVQETLQRALSDHCGELIHVFGAGRTDAGVHASGQVVHFDTASRTPPERYPEALGRHLPHDLAVVRSEEVDDSFHARFSATSRIYRYAIVPGRRSPLTGRFAWMPRETGDWDLLGREAARIVGERDFRCFCGAGDYETTVRRIMRARLRRAGDAGLLTVEANGFLRGMVRWIVGALWSRATGRLDEDGLGEMLAGRSRPRTLIPAPPQGLCLVEVRYGGMPVCGDAEMEAREPPARERPVQEYGAPGPGDFITRSSGS